MCVCVCVCVIAGSRSQRTSFFTVNVEESDDYLFILSIYLLSLVSYSLFVYQIMYRLPHVWIKYSLIFAIYLFTILLEITLFPRVTPINLSVSYLIYLYISHEIHNFLLIYSFFFFFILFIYFIAFIFFFLKIIYRVILNICYLYFFFLVVRLFVSLSNLHWSNCATVFVQVFKVHQNIKLRDTKPSYDK